MSFVISRLQLLIAIVRGDIVGFCTSWYILFLVTLPPLDSHPATYIYCKKISVLAIERLDQEGEPGLQKSTWSGLHFTQEDQGA